jgi:hypothetical protein
VLVLRAAKKNCVKQQLIAACHSSTCHLSCEYQAARMPGIMLLTWHCSCDMRTS